MEQFFFNSVGIDSRLLKFYYFALWLVQKIRAILWSKIENNGDFIMATMILTFVLKSRYDKFGFGFSTLTWYQFYLTYSW